MLFFKSEQRAREREREEIHKNKHVYHTSSSRYSSEQKLVGKIKVFSIKRWAF